MQQDLKTQNWKFLKNQKTKIAKFLIKFLFEKFLLRSLLEFGKLNVLKTSLPDGLMFFLDIEVRLPKSNCVFNFL